MPKTPAVPAARQTRSILTHDLLCDAAEAALREGGLALCTIQEVATRADRSPGSVYRRFGDKEGMILAVIARYLERVEAANEANFPVMVKRFPRLEARLKAMIEGSAAAQRRDWRLVQAFRDAAAESSNKEITDSMLRVRGASLDLAKRALRGCSSEIAHKNTEQAIEFAVLMMVGAMEVMTRGPTRAITDKAYQAELQAMIYGYLTGRESKPGTKAKTKAKRA